MLELSSVLICPESLISYQEIVDMPIHRSLTREKFIKAMDPALMQDYFKKRHPDAALPAHLLMEGKEIDEFVADPRNVQAAGILKEDFRRINDICQKGKNHVVRAYNHFSINRSEDMTLQSLAMNLFLNHPAAFDYAYAWFCYYNTASKLSHHQMPGTISLSKEKLGGFLGEIKAWFKDLEKGKECLITHYQEDGVIVILVKHGSYIRTVAYWEEEKVKFHSFRPANEDILLYSKKDKLLSIKASLPKDREQYIKSFSRCLMGDESLAEREDRDAIYTLKPLQNGSFNWNGNKDIKRIILTRVKVQLPGETEPVIELSSNDVRKSLAEDFSEMSLKSVKLICAGFRFFLEIDGKTEKVSFMISPPDVSDLTKKNHAEIIAAYLEEQGVKLI